MDLKEYQSKARVTAIYPESYTLLYPVLGLCGEAGEVAEKVKKLIRDSENVMSEDTRQLLIKELGDVLWYLASCAHDLGTDLEEVAQINLAKLAARQSKNLLQGSGDTREVGPKDVVEHPNIYHMLTPTRGIST